MILDNLLSYNQKILISILVGSLWIYCRTFDNYSLLPRKSFISVILVALWIYLNYMDPLFLPIGLFIMFFYSEYVSKRPAF